jgi:excisionase family DNA binding protein
MFSVPIIELTMKDAVLRSGEEVFDYHGLAAYLKIPEGTLRHWVMEGRIPFTKLGFHVRFSKKAIDTWFEENRRDRKGKGNTGGKPGAGNEGAEGLSLFEGGETT